MSDRTTAAARCDAMAKQIAELDPNWPQPGMACRDFGTASEWRRVRGGWWGNCITGDYRFLKDGEVFANDLADLSRLHAIANGPDWRDDSTLGCLLLSLGDEVRGATSAEAILSAKLAQLGADRA